jgi:SAM-dependent methyltransferase
MLKGGIRIVKKKGLCCIVDNETEVKVYKPWMGNLFSPFYDVIMKRFIFPRKIGGEQGKHYEILRQELSGVHGKKVLELATGSGSTVNFLPNDNQYTGIDVSPALLKRAVKNFHNAGFNNAEFYVTGAKDLPFVDDSFDVVLCILALNFFDDLALVFKEINRVLAPGAMFICSVPVPGRNRLHGMIRGTLYSEKEVQEKCRESGFSFASLPAENGALLYFKAVLR